MATLNVKGFPDDLYQRLRETAKQSRRSVSQEVVHLLAEALVPPERLSILKLRGLGKELWKDGSAAEFVARERRSWD